MPRVFPVILRYVASATKVISSVCLPLWPF